jgi:hypothetical protein
MLSRRDGASGQRRATSGTGRSLAGFSGGRRIGDDMFFGALPMLRGCARNGPHRSLRHVASALAPCGWRAPFCWLAARGNPEQRDEYAAIAREFDRIVDQLNQVMSFGITLVTAGLVRACYEIAMISSS